MRRIVICFLTMAAGSLFCGCSSVCCEKQAQQFIEKHTEKIAALEKQAALAEWESERSGRDEHFKRLEQIRLRIKDVYSDREDFALIKKFRESGGITDPITARVLDVLYYDYLGNQVNPESLKQMVILDGRITQKFNVFRGKIDGREVTEGEIKQILRKENDSALRKKAWEASKQVGAVVVDDIKEQVKLRNKSAKELGFDNFHTFMLYDSELSTEDVDGIFDKLYELTNEPYRELKSQIDGVLAERYGVEVSQLRPWHYHDPFFQEAPAVYEVDLDEYYEDKDIAAIAEKFYTGIGLEVDDILAKSDLYERPGKCPHGFSIDMDRSGDTRILVNIRGTERWMETVLHELGHSVYFKYYAPQNPYVLRAPAHIFTTEGIAMFFGRLSSDEMWMQQMLALDEQQKAAIKQLSEEYTRAKQLVFARWAMVMYEFEKELYANPGQDLNTLWWDLVEKYQFVNRPDGRDEPDWAAKFHIAVEPCYYHNYMLGELFASQIHSYIVREVNSAGEGAQISYVNRPEVGRFLREKIFEPGRLYRWEKLMEEATGESLEPQYFVRQFVK